MEMELVDVPLPPVLDDVLETLQVQAREKGLELVCGDVPPELTVQADESRLRQILVNVVGNAVKFTREGSVAVRVEAPAGSPYVEIEVKDTGIGIPVQRREFLFQKFSQGDASLTRKFGGSGLGLVIVKELCEMMGGTVSVESPGDDQGTTVCVSLVRGRPTETAPR